MEIILWIFAVLKQISLIVVNKWIGLIAFDTVSSLYTDCDVSVSEYSRDVHENIQYHLHHTTDWSLEWLHAVLRSNAARLSLQYMGRHQRAAGISTRLLARTVCFTSVCLPVGRIMKLWNSIWRHPPSWIFVKSRVSEKVQDSILKFCRKKN